MRLRVVIMLSTIFVFSSFVNCHCGLLHVCYYIKPSWLHDSFSLSCFAIVIFIFHFSSILWFSHSVGLGELARFYSNQKLLYKQKFHNILNNLFQMRDNSCCYSLVELRKKRLPFIREWKKTWWFSVTFDTINQPENNCVSSAFLLIFVLCFR